MNELNYSLSGQPQNFRRSPASLPEPIKLEEISKKITHLDLFLGIETHFSEYAPCLKSGN